MTYVKTSNGLQPTDQSKVKNYSCAADVEAAISDSSLKEGEWFSIPAGIGIHEDIVSDVQRLLSYTPTNASATNQFATQADLPTSDLTNLTNRVSTLETNSATKTELAACPDSSTVNQLGARVGVNETNIACRVQCCDLTSICSDIYTCIGTVESANETFIEQSFNPVKTDVTNLKSCAGLACTGTVVATDIADMATCTYLSNNYMTCTDLASTYAGKAIESCDGLACVGSVTAVCDTYSNTRYTPDANGVLCFRIQGMTASFQNGVLTICSL